MTDDEFEREHPSYGLVRISRMSGGTGQMRLFGSPLATHYGTIRLTIGSAKWIHGLGRDRYFGSIRGEHIEIEMSAAQFADMITSLNLGDGTPCTIRYVNGARVENPPDLPTEAEYIRDNFENSLDKYKAKSRSYRKKIEELAQKLSAKAREEIRVALDVMEDQLSANVPFVVKQFQEAATKVTTAAKAEVEAFVSHAIRSAGLSAIADGRLPSLLPSGDKKDSP
jgi:hypothetical protein